MYWELKDIQKKIQLKSSINTSSFIYFLNYCSSQFFLVGCKARNALRSKQSVIVGKSKELMKRLNSLQDRYTVSDKNFTEADFPWIPLEKRSILLFIYLKFKVNFNFSHLFDF